MRKVQFGVDGPQRPVTRVAAVVVGLFFIVVPIASPFVHANQRQELASASFGLILAIGSMVVVSFVLGSIFLALGISGNVPSWLAKRINEHCR